MIRQSHSRYCSEATSNDTIPFDIQIMSSNVGLSTPRGSGTSGYIQGNKAHLKPRSQPYPSSNTDAPRYKPRQPDPQILEHTRKRAIEVEVFALRDELETEGKLDEDEIDDRCDALRQRLQKEAASGKGGVDARHLKSHQVHELAKAKIEESERLRKALGIKETYEEGSHWRRHEERKADAERERASGGRMDRRGNID